MRYRVPILFMLFVLVMLVAVPAWAASPTVVTTTSGGVNTGGSPATLNLPSGVQAGNMLIAGVYRDGTGGSITFAGGWTELGTQHDNGQSMGAAACRIAAGAETTFDVTATADIAYVVYRITGHNGDCTAASVEGASSEGNASNPDSPDLNPSGWGTEDALALSIALIDSGTANDKFSAAPTNYTNVVNSGALASINGQAIGAQRALTAASSENPDAYTLTSGDDWVAFTILIRGTSSAACTGRLALLGVGC